jgi:hypothetical protein
MSYLSGNTQPRGNQPMHPDEVQNHFYSCTYTSSALCPGLSSLRKPSSCLLPPHALPYTPCLYKPILNSFVCSVPQSAPSADEQRYPTEGFETAQTYQPLWVANMSYYGEIPPSGIHSLVGFSFDNTDANIRGEGDLGFLGSLTTDQQPNITTNESSLVPPNLTIAAPNPSVSSTTPLPLQVQPAPPVKKYQCTTCRRGFDRESRLENCHNRHSGIKPHRCFGVCGTVQWYVTPRFIRPPQYRPKCSTECPVR